MANDQNRETRNNNGSNDPPSIQQQQSSAQPEQPTTRRSLPLLTQQRNRAVAEREASRLARPDRPSASNPLGHASKQRSAVSSTPFGFDTFSQKQTRTGSGSVDNDREKESTTGNNNDSWCGPFSVARQMIASREDARRKREEESEEKKKNENGEHHPLDAMLVEAELEKKRKANPSMMWRSSIKNEETERKGEGREKDPRGKVQNLYYKRQKRYEQEQRQRQTSSEGSNVLCNLTGKGVPTLFQICVSYIVQHFEHVEALGLYGNTPIRNAIAESLIANGKMNGAAFETLAEVGIESLELIDCSCVTQDQMAESLAELVPAGLRALILNHAGRCFGPKVVDAIVSCGKPLISLFAISIGGAHLLKDIDAAKLVSATAHTLSSIELIACPRIGPEFCKSLHGNGGSGSCTNLLELSLEDIPFTKENLLMIVGKSSTLSLPNKNMKVFKNLKSISLKQIEAVDDEVISTLLQSTGEDLSGIHIANNIHMTDQSLSSIREHNTKGQLKSLQLSGLPNLTSTGLETFFTFDIPGLPDPPSLRKLDLSNCGEGVVTDHVVDLVLSSSALKRQLTQKSSYATKGNNPTVRCRQPGAEEYSSEGGIVSMNLSSSGLITDKSMEHLAAKSVTSLMELEINFCPRISDKGLGYLVSKVGKQFTKLNIWGCAQITDDFLDGHESVEDDGVSSLVIEGAWMKQSGKRSVR